MTVGGVRLYTEQQVKEILAERRQYLAARRRRREEKALAAHQLAIALGR